MVLGGQFWLIAASSGPMESPLITKVSASHSYHWMFAVSVFNYFSLFLNDLVSPSACLLIYFSPLSSFITLMLSHLCICEQKTKYTSRTEGSIGSSQWVSTARTDGRWWETKVRTSTPSRSSKTSSTTPTGMRSKTCTSQITLALQQDILHAFFFTQNALNENIYISVTALWSSSPFIQFLPLFLSDFFSNFFLSFFWWIVLLCLHSRVCLYVFAGGSMPMLKVECLFMYIERAREYQKSFLAIFRFL